MSTSPLESSGLPPALAHALERMKVELQQAAGANLAGLILFGGLARGSYIEGFSDVNLVVLLRDASATGLAAIARVLQDAWRAWRVEPLILTPAEVPHIADAFPTKLLDIQEHHLLLYGENPFSGIVVSREHVRLRIEQELRNLQLRLRRRYIAVASDPAAMTVTLANTARPLAIELAALLRLLGKSRPADDHSTTIFAAAALAFDLNGGALAQLAELRRDQRPVAEARTLYEQVLSAIGRAAEIADSLEEARS